MSTSDSPVEKYRIVGDEVNLSEAALSDIINM
jgi:hypothetical protein